MWLVSYQRKRLCYGTSYGVVWTAVTYILITYFLVHALNRFMRCNLVTIDVFFCYLKEELQTLSDWLLNEGKHKVAEYNLCPPPVKPLLVSACSAPRCVENIECKPKNNDTYLCCFNGCVETCMRALDPQPVFDWIEEPPEAKKLIFPVRAEHSSPPEAVALPGGCVITPKQYLSLQGFKENEHITDCFCDVDGVFCKVAES